MDGSDSGGGSRGLTGLIDEYGEHLAGDLLEVYGIDLRDVLRPESGLTPLFLLALIRGLPMDGRFNSERRGGQEFRGWDAGRYVDVATVNAVRSLQWAYVAAHSKSKPKPPEPFPLPDKGVRKRDVGPGSFAAVAAARLSAAKKAKGGG